uniref:Uncharacterized protein n=1 Tax=viral metagenome TaxID=1070528 RepID=A0A6M3MG45_9ZZZZ
MELLDTPLRKVYGRIISMIGVDIWDQRFVRDCLDGFAQCLKTLDADYETIDLLTLYYHMKLEAEGVE